MSSCRATRTVAVALRLVAALAFVLAAVGASAQNILVYDDTTDHHRAQNALASLGYTFSVGDAYSFDALLTGGTWDLVVVDCPSTDIYWDSLVSYIEGGGKAIMSYWALQTAPALATAFGVSPVTLFDLPQTVYVWDASSPVFTTPNTLGDLTSWSDSWADDGHELGLLAGSTALAGFTSSPTADKAAIVLANSGRTIYNGFLFDELNDPAGTQLIANEANLLLNGSSVPEPSALALLIGGAIGGSLFLRRRRA